jgi:uroporphyrinogen-III decarboxylase
MKIGMTNNAGARTLAISDELGRLAEMEQFTDGELRDSFERAFRATAKLSATFIKGHPQADLGHKLLGIITDAVFEFAAHQCDAGHAAILSWEQSKKGSWARNPSWVSHAAALLQQIEKEGRLTTPPKIAQEILDRWKDAENAPPSAEWLAAQIRKRRKPISTEPGSVDE